MEVTRHPKKKSKGGTSIVSLNLTAEQRLRLAGIEPVTEPDDDPWWSPFKSDQGFEAGTVEDKGFNVINYE